MINLAGSSYDYGNVLFAVLQECEHQRRSLLPNEAEERLREIAKKKLSEIRVSYTECGGTAGYWRTLEREVLETALPQYVPAAIEQTRLERTNYGLWRQADPVARAVFALIGLVIGSLIVVAPFIPIWGDAFVFCLAAAFFLYPEIKKGVYDVRHSRLLNRLIVQAEAYQKNERIHYVSEAQIEEELAAVEETAKAVPPRKAEWEGKGNVVQHPGTRSKER
ncbi:MAG TPA: hypothetical protein VJ725_18705 [Thermoanaerobaculia bacterium]|nr:hypothetical protein [Thermoanaerobaculia bacterium]